HFSPTASLKMDDLVRLRSARCQGEQRQAGDSSWKRTPPCPNTALQSGLVIVSFARRSGLPTYPSISTAKRTHDSSWPAVDLPRLIPPVPSSAISSLRRKTAGFPPSAGTSHLDFDRSETRGPAAIQRQHC